MRAVTCGPQTSVAVVAQQIPAKKALATHYRLNGARAIDGQETGETRYGESMTLNIKPRQQCRWDLVSLGEVMLRLDPGDKRIWTTRSFDVYEGGGEYNVARGLKRCFRLETAIVTAFADNPVGRLVQDLIYQGGVDQSLIKWIEYDSVGRTVRNGLNFTERGYGMRAALGCSDRGHTAISQAKPGDFDWESIFGKSGARWFHTGGIFCALSESTPEVAIEALQAARQHGVITSYDLNYRESLWKAIGGKKTRPRSELQRSFLRRCNDRERRRFLCGLGLRGSGTGRAPLEVGRRKLQTNDRLCCAGLPIQSRSDNASRGEDRYPE